MYIFLSLANELLLSLSPLTGAFLILQSCLNRIHGAQALMGVMLRYWKIGKIETGVLKKSAKENTTTVCCFFFAYDLF